MFSRAVKDFRSVTAGGVLAPSLVARDDWQTRFPEDEKITGLEPLDASAVKLQRRQDRAIVAIEGKPTGILEVDVPIILHTRSHREASRAGLQLVMLTGDNRRTAAR